MHVKGGGGLVNNGLWFVSLLRHRTHTTVITLRFFFSSAGEMLKVVCTLWIWQPGWVMYRLPPAAFKRQVQADWKKYWFIHCIVSVFEGGERWVSEFLFSRFLILYLVQIDKIENKTPLTWLKWGCGAIYCRTEWAKKHPHTEICDLFNVSAQF